MFKKIRHVLAISCLALPLLAQADCSNLGREDGNSICHITFTSIPTYANFNLGTPQSGVYTIHNNTPSGLYLNYIRIQDNDPFPAAATTIGTAPANDCINFMKPNAKLPAGGSCNIQLNLIPLSIGTFNRVLQIGVDSRQVELDAPAILAQVKIPPAPPVPPTPTPPSPTPPPPSLFSATILGASTVTSTGLSTVNGDVDLSPGSSITGFPPGIIVNGAKHISDATANTAQADALAYYNSAVALMTSTSCPGSARDLTGQDLGGKTLSPGVYCFSSSAQLTGQLTLSGGATDAFVFVIGSTLTTASNSKVVLTSGATSGNVTWAVGSSATIGTGTAFQGIIVASSSITLATGASLLGRAWALNGAVTLDNNAVNPN